MTDLNQSTTPAPVADDFDISNFEVENTLTFQLKDAAENLMFTRHPTEKDEDGEPVKIPVTATVYGPGSVEHAKATAWRNSQQMQKLRKKGKFELSADETLELNAEYLARVTKEFSPNFRYSAAGGATGHDLHKAVFMNRKLGFIADQFGEKLGDWENFSKGSATN